MINNKNLIRTFLVLAIPTILEQLLSTVLQYVDTAMVGHLGARATAAISLSTSYSWFFGSIIGAIGLGYLSYIARAIGENNEYNVKHAMGMALNTAIVVGAILTVVTMVIAPYIPIWMGAEAAIVASSIVYYRIVNIPMIFKAVLVIMSSVLRATHDTATPMKINISVNIINIAMNYLCIYVLGMGVTGAAIATAISYFAGGTAMFVAFTKNRYVSMEKQYFRLEKRVLSDALAIGIPTMITRMISCLGHIVATSFVSSMGTVIFAAHAIAITAEQLFYIPGYGMQAATSTLIGNSIGEKDDRKKKDVMKISLLIVISIMAISGVLLFVFASGIMSLFTNDVEVISIGTILLRIVAFTEPLYGAYIVMDGIYVGLGRTKYPMVVELIGHWGVRILSAYILINYFNAGIREYWYCMILDNICKAILLAAGLIYIIKASDKKSKIKCS